MNGMLHKKRLMFLIAWVSFLRQANMFMAVIPGLTRNPVPSWIPASAGMTVLMSFVAGVIIAAGTNLWADEWGTVMSARSKINIRAERSQQSDIVGKLEAGQSARVDFLKNGWYAVFNLKEQDRNENKALGYVLASLLQTKKQETKVKISKLSESGSGLREGVVDQDIRIAVKEITFDIDEKEMETISIEFNRFYVPALYSIEEKTKRVILTVTDTDFMKKEWSLIPVKGKWIRQIRSSLDEKTKMMRIEIDLAPAKRYSLNLALDRSKNIYTLEVVGIDPFIPDQMPHYLHKLPWR
jgi:hypothetical protein